MTKRIPFSEWIPYNYSVEYLREWNKKHWETESGKEHIKIGCGRSECYFCREAKNIGEYNAQIFQRTS